MSRGEEGRDGESKVREGRKGEEREGLERRGRKGMAGRTQGGK